MCGIAAIVDDAAPAEARRAVLHAMLERMAHRGPDDRGIHDERDVTLGMCRLAIIDLSADGHQPMHNETGDVSVVFNGEIYDFAELRAELLLLGHRFRSRADTEVLVHGYEQWGIDGLLTRLNGMFTFALFDRSADTLHVARDRLGVKPLYCWREGGRTVLASELRALLAHPAFSPALDEAALPAYLLYQFVPGPRTVLRGVEKVPPGTRLEIRGPTVRSHCYWRPHPGAVDATPAAREARCRDLLTDAVRRQLVADVPVGVFLSGGLDSSLLAALASRVTTEPLRTFSIGFGAHQGFDESPFSAAVARHLGSVHRAVTFGGNDLAALLDPVIDALDEPIGDAAAMPTYLLSRLAAREVTVVLTGEGADEIFGGYAYYGAAGHARRWWQRPRAPAPDVAVSGFPYAFAPAALARLVPSLPRRSITALLREERRIARRLSSRDPLTAAQGWDASTWLPDDLLMKCDKMTMAHSLEGRVPFLDHRLVELALGLPREDRLGPEGSKAVLRRIARTLLPPEITEREKHGFNLPIHTWIREELRERFEATLRGPAIDATGLLERHEVTRLLDAHLAGADEGSRRLWTLFCLARWWERLRERRGEPTAAPPPPAREAAGGGRR